MTFLIQQGFGKGSKIPDVAADGHLEGVVLSPGDEDPAKLAQTVRSAQAIGLEAWLDPQSYIYAPDPSGSATHHPAHGLDVELSWHATPRQVNATIQAVADANTAAGTTGPRIAPTCWLSSFENIWTPATISLAATAAEEWGGDNTIVTVAASEDAFSDWNAVDRWLDVITTLEVRGFYLLVDRRGGPYPPNAWNVDRLANILRVIYRLGALNDYDVTWGYSDLEGLIGLAAGASHSASGWHYSLRQFNRNKWVAKSAGGSAPTPRILAGRLWAPLKAADEVRLLLENDALDDLFTARELSTIEAKPLEDWGLLDAQLQYLRLLARNADAIVELGDAEERIAEVHRRLLSAERRYDGIESEGILLDPRYVRRLTSMRDALGEMATREDIPL